MDQQTIINGFFGILAVLIGHVVKGISDGIQDAKDANSKISAKVHEIENLVAGQYVTKADFKEATNTLFERIDAVGDRIASQLDRLNEKIDNKVSREDLSVAAREYNRRHTDFKD